MFCSTPTAHRSSVSNMPCLHLAHHSNLAGVKVKYSIQSQGLKSQMTQFTLSSLQLLWGLAVLNTHQ